jgi:5-(hydroxymethyl)furfural/furfural oxidase
VHSYAQERQIPFIADMNADFRDGYGAVPMSNWPDKRASAAICYLGAAVRARGNLTIINGAAATGFIFEGRRVVGVTVRIGGEAKEFRAREVVLSAGGVHSPAFLMRQGIGSAAHLRELLAQSGLLALVQARGERVLGNVPDGAARHPAGCLACDPHRRSGRPHRR